MKKYLSILIAFTLILSSLTILSASAETMEENSVTVNSTDEFKDAITTAEENSTIYLKSGRYTFEDTYTIKISTKILPYVQLMVKKPH